MSTLLASTPLFEPLQIGAAHVAHRVTMAPLTRMRNIDYAPKKPYQSRYYSERTSLGGLVYSEGTVVSPAAGYTDRYPGIWSEEQVRYWKAIVDGIHAKGGVAVMQLFHCGRHAEDSWKVDGVEYAPVSASNTALSSDTKVPAREMTHEEIEQTTQDFVKAARNAIHGAGFDLCEVHCANGYLLDQFLQSNSNLRSDKYGGSVINRSRFPLAVVKAVADAVTPERVGVRLSPFSEFQGMKEEDPMSLFIPFVAQLLQQVPALAFVHLVEARISGAGDREDDASVESLDPIRKVVQDHNLARCIPNYDEMIRQGKTCTKIITAGGFHPESAAEHALKYPSELIAFGRLFISNPGECPVHQNTALRIDQLLSSLSCPS
jgi:NADPH2 dehydrogenase